jgi:hypothetical protein
MLKRLRPELPEGCVSDLRFDALRAGELSAVEADDIAAHAQGCARCQARQRALALDTEAVSTYPIPFAISARLEPRVPDAPEASERALAPTRCTAWLGALALAAVVCFALIPRQDRARGTRTKGGPSISFFVKRGNDVYESLPDEPVAPGDQLRFVVAPSGFAYVAVLSRSAAGQADVYFPQGTQAAPIESGAARYPLQGAVELDDTLENELDHYVRQIELEQGIDIAELKGTRVIEDWHTPLVITVGPDVEPII